MYLRRVSPPLSRAEKLTVVSVDQLKRHARIDDLDEEDLLGEIIEAAYDHLAGEAGWLGRCCLLPEEFEALLPSMRCEPELLMRPFLGDAVTSLEQLGADGAYTDVDGALFRLRPGDVFWRVVAGPSFPHSAATPRRADPGSYRIRFKAGFGNADAVPAPIKLAIKMLSAHFYANREATSEARTVPRQIELGLVALCGRYRISNDHS